MTYVAKMQETHFQAFNRDENNNDNKENKINYFFNQIKDQIHLFGLNFF